MTESQTPQPATEDRSGPPALVLGVILVIAGALLFVGQLLDIGIDDVGWPFIIVGIGVVILILGLFVNREQGMVIGGTITTTVGLVLLYQNSTGRWESWAYAWALVGPAASGLGLALWGATDPERSGPAQRRFGGCSAGSPCSSSASSSSRASSGSAASACRWRTGCCRRP